MHDNTRPPLIVKQLVDPIDLRDHASAARNGDQPRPQRTTERTARVGDDVARVINDPRPKIEIPASRNRLTSEFAAELGRIMARYSFFVKDGIVVAPDTGKTSLAVVTGRTFRTAIEDYVIPFKVATRQSGNLISLRRTISREEAESVLESSQFIKCLPKIRAVNNARFPVLRAAGHVELLPEGYDQESMIYTSAGGPKIEDLGLEKGNKLLLSKFEEFCFWEDDRKRATAVAIAAMLTLFVFNIIPRGTLRPGFLYTANAEGGGKTLLVRLAIVPRVGFTPIGSLPEQEEEIEKRIGAAAIAGAPTLFFDNGKRHISSSSLERAITATNLEGRILGKSQSYQIENMMTVFLTGNGATISGDLRRRVLHIDLFLREAMAENRQIKNPLNEATICAQRADILSALWSITTAWDLAGRPLPKLRLPDFEGWSEVVCGILEHAGFASPCTRAPSGVSGDRDTEDMFKLVAAMPRPKELRFQDLVELCRAHGLFTRILGTNTDEAVEDEESKRGQKNKFSRILTKFDNRIFPEGLTFHVDRSSKNPAFYVAPEKPKGGH